MIDPYFLVVDDSLDKIDLLVPALAPLPCRTGYLTCIDGVAGVEALHTGFGCGSETLALLGLFVDYLLLV